MKKRHLLERNDVDGAAGLTEQNFPDEQTVKRIIESVFKCFASYEEHSYRSLRFRIYECRPLCEALLHMITHDTVHCACPQRHLYH